MKQCESCGMPLQENTTSQFDSRYCIHCQEQETSRLKSREEVREGSIRAAMGAMGLTREEAEKMADQLMPTLPRWQTQ
jgi:hypothetical protein